MAVIVLFCLCTVFVQISTEKEKRILLNDPDVLLARIIKLETAFQQHEATIRQQEIQIQHMNTSYQQEIQHLKILLEKQDTGTTYIRWARRQCPNNNSEMVYSGYAGGGSHDQSGSAAAPVCLPPDPDFAKTSAPDNARIYGAEFDNNFFHPKGNAEDMPCAVCRVKFASSVIMIPGKNNCYPGWNLEYYGYLASNYYNSPAAGSYVCIDIQPEFLPGGSADNNGKLFVSVIGKCGSLQCLPYENNYPLTCVVCSK